MPYVHGWTANVYIHGQEYLTLENSNTWGRKGFGDRENGAWVCQGGQGYKGRGRLGFSLNPEDCVIMLICMSTPVQPAEVPTVVRYLLSSSRSLREAVGVRIVRSPLKRSHSRQQLRGVEGSSKPKGCSHLPAVLRPCLGRGLWQGIQWCPCLFQGYAEPPAHTPYMSGVRKSGKRELRVRGRDSPRFLHHTTIVLDMKYFVLPGLKSAATTTNQARGRQLGSIVASSG